MSEIEALVGLQERAPATFLKALDACHALAAKGFEPSALDVRKKLGDRGSLEVIQAAVKRHRELSGYVGPESLLPVTLANDLVLAAEAVFKRYQKREEGRLDALSEAYAVSVEGLAAELQVAHRQQEVLQAETLTLVRERDEARDGREAQERENTALRAKLQLAHEGTQELKGRVAQLEAKIDTLHAGQHDLQAGHREDLKEQLAAQLTTINRQWEAEVGAWKLRCDTERRALDTLREKTALELKTLREQLQHAQDTHVADQRQLTAFESRVRQLEIQQAQAQREIEGRETMIKATLDQSNAAFQRLQEEALLLRSQAVHHDRLIRLIATQLESKQSPPKILAAVRAMMQT